jgi:ABC-type uncharacterized transport system permease subunit
VDSPWVVALIVFFSIFFMFFLMRLFADMYIVAIALIAAGAAYFIPKEYKEFYKFFTDDMPALNIIGVELSAQQDLLSIYLIAFLIMLFAVLLCLPALPFSATYRQILGANRLSPSEELKIKRWIGESIEHAQEEERFREDI